MARTPDHTILLPTAETTTALAERLGSVLKAGDTILLSGPIGVGKTHFARAIIRARLGDLGANADIPSPTFTLVQTYHSDDTEIWHADLYRLSDSSEVVELGLEDAFSDAICLVEWPDRLGSSLPQNAILFEFALTNHETKRKLRISGGSQTLNRRVAEATNALELDLAN